MIIQDVYLPKYDWAIFIMYSVNGEDDIETILSNFDCPIDLIIEAKNNIQHKNTGFIYNNISSKVTIIALGEIDSMIEFIKTLVHEIYHFVDKVKIHYSLSLEDCAELISNTLSKILCKMQYYYNKL